MQELSDLSAHYRRLDRLISHSSTETMDFGFRFAKTLEPGDVVLFQGHLGSGKTTCIRGICSGLSVSEMITSPTFTLINEYRGRLPVYHFDFYRIGLAVELRDMGIEEYFHGDGVCLVEWPDVAASLLPASHMCLRLYHANEEPAVQAMKTADGRSETGENIRLIEVYKSDPTRH